MTDQTIAPINAPKSRRLLFSRVWRSWWLRASKAQQRRRLETVLTDPHMARDLGLPVRERPQVPKFHW